MAVIHPTVGAQILSTVKHVSNCLAENLHCPVSHCLFLFMHCSDQTAMSIMWSGSLLCGAGWTGAVLSPTMCRWVWGTQCKPVLCKTWHVKMWEWFIQFLVACLCTVESQICFPCTWDTAYVPDMTSPKKLINAHIIWVYLSIPAPGSSIPGLQWLSEQQHLCDTVSTCHDLWPRSLPDCTQPRLSTGSWRPLCGAVSRWASLFTHNAKSTQTKPCNGLLDKTVSSVGVSGKQWLQPKWCPSGGLKARWNEWS